MNVKTFFKHFELLSDAPNAVTKLRESILQLAVNGKLVPQKVADEPASILLERIRSEKEQLIKQGKIRNSEFLPQTLEQDEPVNDGWICTRLGELIELISGQHLGKEEQNENGKGLPYLTGPSDFGEVNPVPTRWTTTLKSIAEQNDILITVKGAGVGKTNILKLEKAAIGRQLMAIRPIVVNHEYIYRIILSAYQKFQALSIGSTVPGIGRKDILNFPIALAPLAEQKRIVEKCDRLLILCDEIEKRQQQRQESIVRMNESAVAQLLSSQNPDDFRQHWQRICNNFDLLYSIPETIPKFRQAILQLAVQGKLVRQDPDDEPSSTLLEQVKADREQLIKEKKIHKEKPLPPLVESELPYELPDRWNWIRLGEIARLIEYGTSEKASDIGIGVPVLRMNNIRDGKLLFDSLKYVDPLIKDLPRLYIQSGDLLFNRTNSYELVGKTGVFRGSNNHYTFASYLIRIALFIDYVSPEFINLAMNSTYFRQTQIEPEITQQCGQANFNGTKLRNAMIPLPPLAEQKRIVAKVDCLMSLCDELEGKLKETRSHSEKLMEVAAREVLAV